MFDSISYAIAAALVTTAIGILASVVANRTAAVRRLEKESLEDALAASKATAATIGAEMAQALRAELPADFDADVVAAKVAELGGARPVVQQLIHTENKLIESLVNSYHQQALFQASVQFWFSVVAATVGFLYILYAAADFQADNWASLLKVLPGVVIDAVAVLFFRQAEQTRQRATELYDRLRIDSNTLVAKEVLSSIEEVKIRSIAQAQIALRLAGVVTKDFDVALLIAPN